jgi:uncharacterized protein YuzE
MGGQMITYSETADALYVQLQEADVEKTVPLDDLRIIDYASDGSVVGVEFLDASTGLDLRGLPKGDQVATLILGLRFSLAV